MNVGDPLEWYFDIPIVSRVYFTASVLTTAACALDLVSPFTLYFNYKLIVEKWQLWRLVTNFLFFGNFSLDFMFHMYFLIRYCRLLEDNSFRGRTADFACLILYGAVCITLIAPFVNIPFMGSALTFMMVYIWGRRNEFVRMNFLGLIPFTAPYLPWVLFMFSFLLGSSPMVDVIGIVVGHVYYYFDDVYPEVARLRGWPVKYYLRAPSFLNPVEDHETDIALGDMNFGQGIRLNEDRNRIEDDIADDGDLPIVDAVRVDDVDTSVPGDVSLDGDQNSENVSGTEFGEEKERGNAGVASSATASSSPKEVGIDKGQAKTLSLRERMLAAAEARAEAKRLEEVPNPVPEQEAEEQASEEPRGQPGGEEEGDRFGLRQRKTMGEPKES